MTKFLHLADLHLGYNQYNSKKRQKDFFYAFRDVINRYALPDKVDFVLVSGDFFDQRQILPVTMNQGISVLKKLEKAGIPVLAIEGNHDNRPFDDSANWLSFLSGLGLLILLEPVVMKKEKPRLRLEPWDARSKKGSYIDLNGVRVIGSRWYGSSVARVIPELADAIRELPRAEFTALMMHLGVGGFINQFAGGVSYEQLAPLRGAVNYLALGHFHKYFTIDDWVHNPGSPESCSVSEVEEKRGALLVTVENGSCRTELMQDYYRRPFVRRQIDLTAFPSAEEAEYAVNEKIDRIKKDWSLPPVVELSLQGRLGFKRHELNIKRIEKRVKDRVGAIVALIKFTAVPTDLPIAAHHVGSSRKQLEQQVIHDLLAQHSGYKSDAEQWAQVVSEMKSMAINARVPEEILNYLMGTERF